MNPNHYCAFLLTAILVSGIQYTKARDQDKAHSIIDTINGKVRGDIRNTSNENCYGAFEGIPYAEPPIGNRRFLRPRPKQSWAENEILDVSDENIIYCIQPDGSKYHPNIGTEDCLYLWVYTPASCKNNEQENLLPVMVWIHGGGLTSGSGNPQEYGPQYFMDDGSVVLVTINYRVNVFGFFSQGNEEVPGNQGLRDQQLALSWVQDNIAAFGGNPDLVTIFGQSAGSYSVYQQVLSPQAKGLFKRAIGQSIGPLGVTDLEFSGETAIRNAQFLAKHVGCGDEQMNDSEQLECLQNLPADTLLKGVVVGFTVNVDGDFAPDDAIVPLNVEETILKGNYDEDLDLLIGSNTEEGLLLTAPTYLDPSILSMWADTWNQTGPQLMFGKFPIDITEDDIYRANEAAKFYLGSLENMNEQHMQEINDMITDAFVQYGTHKFVEIHTKTLERSIYQYIYSYQGQYTVTEDLFGVPGKHGVCHGDELYLQYDPMQYENHPLMEEDMKVSKRLMSLWINFAKYGDPTPPWNENKNDEFYWASASSETFPLYADISGSVPSMVEYSEEYNRRMGFWTQLLN